MAKRGRKTTNANYKKLAAQAARELADKKKALVRAEKALAKAQKTHGDLLGEVARLDMVDRSLKALIDGSEPPQNIKYVYTYPQWVWYPNGNGWYYNYPNNGTITFTTPSTVLTTSGGLGDAQCGSNLQITNSTVNGYNSNYQTANYVPNNGGPTVTLAPTVTLTGTSSALSMPQTGLCMNVGAPAPNGAVLTSNGASEGVTWTTTGTDGSIVVDLSTHAVSEEEEAAGAAVDPLEEAEVEEEEAELMGR